ncbi:Integrase, catalytic core [Sesbania bispinosa]|nr:Integrase, catalytic core [Sesbania bispinosa]
MRIVESGNARFIENGQFGGSEESRKVDIQETTTNVSTPSVSSQVVIPLAVSQSHNMQRQQVNVPTPQNEHIDDEPADNVQVTNDQVVEETQEVALRSIARSLRIYCDNSASVFFSKNDKYSKGAKHMDLKYLSVKEEVQKQRVSIEHIGTDLMIADPLTKGLPPKTFVGHVESMGVMDKSLLT